MSELAVQLSPAPVELRSDLMRLARGEISIRISPLSNGKELSAESWHFIQEELQRRNLFEGTPSGKYDQPTIDALKRLRQRTPGLQDRESFDHKMLGALSREYAGIDLLTNIKEGAHKQPLAFRKLTSSELIEQHAVGFAQELLNHWMSENPKWVADINSRRLDRKLAPIHPLSSKNGQYDPQFPDVVRAFQEQHELQGLQLTGMIDRPTAQALFESVPATTDSLSSGTSHLSSVPQKKGREFSLHDINTKLNIPPDILQVELTRREITLAGELTRAYKDISKPERELLKKFSQAFQASSPKEVLQGLLALEHMRADLAAKHWDVMASDRYHAKQFNQALDKDFEITLESWEQSRMFRKSLEHFVDRVARPAQTHLKELTDSHTIDADKQAISFTNAIAEKLRMVTWVTPTTPAAEPGKTPAPEHQRKLNREKLSSVAPSRSIEKENSVTSIKPESTVLISPSFTIPGLSEPTIDSLKHTYEQFFQSVAENERPLFQTRMNTWFRGLATTLDAQHRAIPNLEKLQKSKAIVLDLMGANSTKTLDSVTAIAGVYQQIEKAKADQTPVDLTALNNALNTAYPELMKKIESKFPNDPTAQTNEKNLYAAFASRIFQFANEPARDGTRLSREAQGRFVATMGSILRQVS